VDIQYLTYHQINKQKWDECIGTADNGLIYACSYYLDAMSENWDAIVLNDYEAVMPLTWKRKYGIYYLYQPFFAASLGVFGKNIDAFAVEHFLKAIPSKFKYWDIYLNAGNFFEIQFFPLYQRMNYVLPLLESYEVLYKNFRDNIKRNVKKAIQLNCFVQKDFPVDEVIALAMEQSNQFSPITQNDYARFKKLYNLLHENKQAITYGIYSSKKQLLASCVFFFFQKRAYYILVGNHPDGKTIGASHALINAFIQDYAGRDLLLDFEGSDKQSLALFYSSFGSQEENYSGLRLNKLPKLLRYFKK
jgi:hypothetical protein